MSRLQTYLFIIHIWDILNRNPFARSIVISMQGSLKIWTEHSPHFEFRILESNNNLRTRQDSEFSKFWPIANVKMYQVFTFNMPKKVLFQHFTKIEWLCVDIFKVKSFS